MTGKDTVNVKEEVRDFLLGRVEVVLRVVKQLCTDKIQNIKFSTKSVQVVTLSDYVAAYVGSIDDAEEDWQKASTLIDFIPARDETSDMYYLELIRQCEQAQRVLKDVDINFFRDKSYKENKKTRLPATVPKFVQHLDDPINYIEQIELLGDAELLDEEHWYRMIVKAASLPVRSWYTAETKTSKNWGKDWNTVKQSFISYFSDPAMINARYDAVVYFSPNIQMSLHCNIKQLRSLADRADISQNDRLISIIIHRILTKTERNNIQASYTSADSSWLNYIKFVLTSTANRPIHSSCVTPCFYCSAMTHSAHDCKTKNTNNKRLAYSNDDNDNVGYKRKSSARDLSTQTVANQLFNNNNNKQNAKSDKYRRCFKCNSLHHESRQCPITVNLTNILEDNEEKTNYEISDIDPEFSELSEE